METSMLRGYDLLVRGAWSSIHARAEKLREELAIVEPTERALGGLVAHYGGAGGSASTRVSVEELNACGNQRLGLQLIAQREGGRILLRDAVRRIHESTLTEASLPSLRATLYRYVKEGGHWTDLGGGYYRLNSYEEPVLAEWRECSVRIRQADGSDRSVRVLIGPEGEFVLEELDGESDDQVGSGK